MQITILGAGFAGIGAAYSAKDKVNYVLYEKDNDWGGLCNNFKVGKFLFDKAVHLSFSQDKLFSKICYSIPHYSHKPESMNFSKGFWIRHPVQNNLRQLPVDERIKIILGFIDSKKYSEKNLNGGGMMSI